MLCMMTFVMTCPNGQTVSVVDSSASRVDVNRCHVRSNLRERGILLCACATQAKFLDLQLLYHVTSSQSTRSYKILKKFIIAPDAQTTIVNYNSHETYQRKEISHLHLLDCFLSLNKQTNLTTNSRFLC